MFLISNGIILFLLHTQSAFPPIFPNSSEIVLFGREEEIIYNIKFTTHNFFGLTFSNAVNLLVELSISSGRI